MIWILSPSKTQHTGRHGWPAESSPMFEAEADALVAHMLDLIQNHGLEELGKRLKIKGAQLEKVHTNYQTWAKQPNMPAIERYTGSVFKGMAIESYGEAEKAWLRQHVRILSALYGVLTPFDGIKPYRLDMTCRVFDKSAHAFWEPKLKDCFTGLPVVNLASTEFSALLPTGVPMLTIEFKERLEEGRLVTKSTYAKMARGKMMDFAIRNKVESTEQIKDFAWGGYGFCPDLSNEATFVFVRETSINQ